MSQHTEDEKVIIRVSPIQFLATLVYLLADRQNKAFEVLARELQMPYGPLRIALTYLHRMFDPSYSYHRDAGPVRLKQQDYLLELDTNPSVAWGSLEMFGLFYLTDTEPLDPHALVTRFLAKSPGIEEFPGPSFLARLSRILIPDVPQQFRPDEEYQTLLRHNLRLSRAEAFLRQLLSNIAQRRLRFRERLEELSRRDLNS